MRNVLKHQNNTITHHTINWCWINDGYTKLETGSHNGASHMPRISSAHGWSFTDSWNLEERKAFKIGNQSHSNVYIYYMKVSVGVYIIWFLNLWVRKPSRDLNFEVLLNYSKTRLNAPTLVGSNKIPPTPSYVKNLVKSPSLSQAEDWSIGSYTLKS